ncbi:prophage MuMc02, F protein precursor [Candidatus Puniceispirillum marinum IMCC1322]|uniref:Prophage MuMc02, F protein n=1 Tax=Puniceispirillum marinum (strain IMCC1322) TaxID=488538 RepID=D5BQE7_PUNMI|nr:prophage MuMc02, F protein precursor [Candidatus Puniceispirillum marinum IMCC1322]
MRGLSGTIGKRAGGAEMRVKMRAHGSIQLVKGYVMTQRIKRGDARIGDAAGDNRVKGGQIGCQIDSDAMPADPAADAHADGGDLVIAGEAVAIMHPYAGQPRAPRASDAKITDDIDDPAFERMHIGADVATTGGQIKHDIGDTLTRAMICPLPAASGAMRGGGGIGDQQISITRRSATGIDGGMFEQPYGLSRARSADRGIMRGHGFDDGQIGLKAGKALPCHGGCAR